MFTKKKITPKSKLDLLRSVPLFAGCTDKELSFIDRLVDEVEFHPDEALTTEGSIGRECFIVLDGEAAVLAGGVEVATVGPGSLVGEMAILEHQPRSATVVARTPLRVLALDTRGLLSLVVQERVAAKLLRDLSFRLRAATALAVTRAS